MQPMRPDDFLFPQVDNKNPYLSEIVVTISNAIIYIYTTYS